MTPNGRAGDVAGSAYDVSADLEARLLGHAGVEDCIVRVRTLADAPAIVAYVVSERPIPLESLQAHVRAHGTRAVPAAVVRVSHVPLTADGRVDEERLARLPVIDASTLEQYRADVLATPGVADAEVTREWRVAPPRDLAVADVLPPWTPLPGPAAPVAPPADRDPAAPASRSVGGPIEPRAGRPAGLADLLVRAAAVAPAATITCVDADGEHVCTYADLLARARRIAGGLRAAGLRPGDRLVFQFDRNADVIPAFWGAVFAGVVPAPLAVAAADPSSAGAAKVRNVRELLGRPRVFTTDRLRPSRLRLREALDSPAPDPLTIEHVLASGADGAPHRSRSNDLALLLLTSGSTGVPKAVMQTHGAILAAAAAMAQQNGFTSRDVPVNWIGLDHVGGLVMTHVMFVMLGSRQVHARTDYVMQDPLRWLDLIDRHRGTFTWAPNFAYALVNDRAAAIAGRTWDLSSMAFVLTGGEAVVMATTQRFLRLLAPFGLPGTAMRPAWGMSETCAAATFAAPLLAEAPGAADGLVEVGPPNPGFEMRIVDERSAVVPEGQSGRLEVRGPNVTCGYFANPEANAEAFTADGWFRTGDLGRLAGGRLTITGREKGVIIVNGANYHAHEIEAAVEDVAGVTPSFVAAFPVRDPGADTDALAVAFHAAAEADAPLLDLMRRVRSAVLERTGAQPAFLLPVAQADIPKTDIGKIQRAALTRRFEAGGFAGVVRRVQRLTDRAETLPDWFFRPVWRTRRAERHYPIDAGTVAILVGRGDAGAALASAIRATGAQCLTTPLAALADRIGTVPAARRVVVVATAEGCDAAPFADAAELAERYAMDAVALVRAAAAWRGPSPCDLLVLDSGVQAVTPADRTLPGKATALGIYRSAGAEYPHLSVRHVDVPDARAAGVADLLLCELADGRREGEVAYRGGERWVRRLEHRAPRPSPSGHPFGRTGGFYLVTGGAGRIGADICTPLLRRTNAALLLIGRTPAAALSERQRRTLASLQSMGDVRYEAVDVADFEALARVVDAMAADGGRPLAGVLHLAGSFEPRLIADHTSQTIAAALGAKVRGAWNLHRLLDRHPGAALIAFSSVNGQLGGYAAAGYAAANAFLDSLVEHGVRACGRAGWSLGWSLWEGPGPARLDAHRESAERRGYRAIGAPHAWLSLLGVAGSAPGHVLIGLDAAHPHIQRRLDGDVVTETVAAVWARTPGATDVLLPVLADRFGRFVRPAVVEAGDAAALRSPRPATMAPAGGTGETALERLIAGVWRSLLPAGHLGPNDNFFDAGGNSLLVAQASHALADALGRDVPITDLYECPTVRLLAAHYGGRTDADAAGLEDSEQRGQARRARRLQGSRRRS